MDSSSLRHITTYLAKVVAPRLTQGQIDFHYQYRWKGIEEMTVTSLAKELITVQTEIDRKGEDEWASEQEGKRDPLRKKEIPLGNKTKMDWEW